MVPSICPLETLHNSLSLKQVDDFLASIATSHDSLLELSVCSPGKRIQDTTIHIHFYIFFCFVTDLTVFYILKSLFVVCQLFKEGKFL